MGTILYEGPLFLSSPHSTSKNKRGCICYPARLRAIVVRFFFFCGLISLIQILPRQQLLNQSYLQEETHLGKFYVERHIMRKIWCCRTGDKSDLNDTEELLATDLAEQTGVLISQWCVPSNSAPVLSCPAETPNFHDLTSSHLTPLLTICPLTHEHSDTMKTLSHRH